MRGGLTREDRFFAKVRVAENGCWEWVGYRNADGYGRFRSSPTSVAGAHRWSYEFFVGPIPDGLVMDHLCRNPPCVNPDHLEPVTTRENVVRGLVPLVSAEWKRRITECPRGHPYDEVNTRHSAGHRFCRTCDRDYQREKARAIRSGTWVPKRPKTRAGDD